LPGGCPKSSASASSATLASIDINGFFACSAICYFEGAAKLEQRKTQYTENTEDFLSTFIDARRGGIRLILRGRGLWQFHLITARAVHYEYVSKQKPQAVKV